MDAKNNFIGSSLGLASLAYATIIFVLALTDDGTGVLAFNPWPIYAAFAVLLLSAIGSRSRKTRLAKIIFYFSITIILAAIVTWSSIGLILSGWNR